MGPVDAYTPQIERVLPRLLALYDTNPVSPTRGLGDRYRWAWKLIDFGNATFQGAGHGLARLLVAGLLPPELPPERALARIDEMVDGVAGLADGDGSVGEAFPHEGSFCVTALVANDVLAAAELLGERVDRDRYLKVAEPLVRFVERTDETHAFITNHLATAVSALVRWHALTGDGGLARAERLLRRILDAQDPDGWFPEYDGADPGYQSLATHYLADAHRRRPDLELLEPIRRSLSFLNHFALPDGTFGGLYGSRNTRFLAPGGIEALASELPEAAALAAFAREAIARRTVVTLETMDEPNLVPLFNSYCWAAAVARETPPTVEPPPLRPEGAPRRRVFASAGLLVDYGEAHYTVVSLHKGGVVHHVCRGAPSVIDAGVAAVDDDGATYTTQAHRTSNEWHENGEIVRVRAPFSKLKTELPSALQFAALRVGSATVLRSARARRIAKRLLVRRVIGAAAPTTAVNQRTIHLGPELRIEDDWSPARLRRLATPRGFSALHMASQGYWQAGDDQA